MKVKEVFEFFGGKPIGELFYLFTLIFIWAEFIIPVLRLKIFVSILFGLFIVSRAGLLLFSAYEKEEKKK